MRHRSGRERARAMLADAGIGLDTTVSSGSPTDLERPSPRAFADHTSYDHEGYDPSTGLKRGGVAHRPRLPVPAVPPASPVAAPTAPSGIAGAPDPAADPDQPAFRRGGSVRR